MRLCKRLDTTRFGDDSDDKHTTSPVSSDENLLYPRFVRSKGNPFLSSKLPGKQLEIYSCLGFRFDKKAILETILDTIEWITETKWESKELSRLKESLKEF
ncbi:unnamed protein product [Hermetia illucens]|uniref:Uncharacterized protein n=1 Tax=Hermetia illucens TaxID=343691 RepID=A0A7R8USW8_HERIL|nr:unnamed protein product [Hermetia illucens]